MAGVERAKRALWSLLRSYNAKGSAKLTVTTVKGKLKVILEESFDVQPIAVKAPKTDLIFVGTLGPAVL